MDRDQGGVEGHWGSGTGAAARIPALQLLRRQRVELVEKLEERVDWLLEQALQTELITKDDYEDVKYVPGPRRRVRTLLDIIDCRGELVANEFCSLVAKSEGVADTGIGTSEHHAVVKKHRQVLLRRNESMMYYNSRAGEKVYLQDQFTELLLVSGHPSVELKQHELLSLGQQRIELQERGGHQIAILPEQLFQRLTDRRAPGKVLLTGVAGIGKTMLLQKLAYDWASGRCLQNFWVVLQLTFRDLNLADNPVTLRRLVLRKNGHLAKVLDLVFEEAQVLLIILDGFDEFKFCASVDGDCYVTDPDEEGQLPDVINSLLRGELLPGVSVLLTSRPTAVAYIPVEIIDRFVVITGFSEKQIKDFFLKYYQDEGVSSRVFALVKENHFLFTLCFIPAFCYIVCSVLKDEGAVDHKQPKTMTDIYSRYLTMLLRHHSRPQLDGAEDLTQMLCNLGRLAYTKLLQHETLFYRHELQTHHIELNTFVNSFLDRTCVQEPDCVEDIFSFAHFTIQEFLAALHYVLEPRPLPDIMDTDTCSVSLGYLDIFHRFVSGLLSERNQTLLSKHLKLGDATKLEVHHLWLLEGITESCEKGSGILNLLHCLFEQQNPSLAERLTPRSLHIHVGDNIICPMDLSALQYFLDLQIGDVVELDVTATNISGLGLRTLQPYLKHCESLWCGENKLDSEAIHFLSELLKSQDYRLKLLGLGWTDIGNKELREICDALKENRTLQELWIEGSNADYDGISAFAAVSSNNSTLKKVVFIGHRLAEEDAARLKQELLPGASDRIVAWFCDDYQQWQGWCDWVCQRSQTCTDEKLVQFLSKIFSHCAHRRMLPWMSQWCAALQELLQQRIGKCRIAETRRKLQKLRGTIELHC
ncbi:LOW QUALITY PROTEIN: NLR family CARD domain-containing protein 3-like [Hemitrygon akajei]|uniref:LOW QUALITY PROTEIN: NLR family CARD domain-containing protein 3-like n=1 Tax=Hemitrygon akajei TaxID=2704970 RepID=UPI003BF95017